MFCGRCGENNPDIDRFCFECGARLLSARTDPGVQITDEVSARLAGLGSLPEPVIEWPEDLPRTVQGDDGAELLLVPAGFFHMGERKKKKDERPNRLVYLDSYYIDAVPVTNGRYADFVERTGAKKPPGFSPSSDEGWRDTPVTSVTWDEAVAYARWALRRLPTEAEWEKAARGIDSRTWPWGDREPNGSVALAAFGDDDGTPVPVGRFPEGKSPYGALDMAGNVWEWCQDQYDQHFYPRSSPRNPRCDDGDPRYRVLRGGACTYSAFTMRASFRGFNLPRIRVPVYGFRCAVDAMRFRKRSPK